MTPTKATRPPAEAIATSPLADVSLRDACQADEAFLRRVYAESRADELSVLDWTKPQIEEFLRMQFDAQDQHYKTSYPDAAYQVIERAERPIGRLYLERTDQVHHVIDIALLQSERGRGVGGALMRRIITDAESLERSVVIFVEQNNPAMRLYERLGFRSSGTFGVYEQMHRRPGQKDFAQGAS